MTSDSVGSVSDASLGLVGGQVGNHPLTISLRQKHNFRSANALLSSDHLQAGALSGSAATTGSTFDKHSPGGVTRYLFDASINEPVPEPRPT